MSRFRRLILVLAVAALAGCAQKMPQIPVATVATQPSGRAYLTLDQIQPAPGFPPAVKYRGIGIRIEDDVLVTAKGCRNLSGGIPSEPDDVERWMRRLWKSKV